MPRKYVKKNAGITVADIYAMEVHGITFTILDRVLGAKIYKHASTGCELRLNFEGNVRKVHLSIDEVRTMKKNIDNLLNVAEAKQLSMMKVL